MTNTTPRYDCNNPADQALIANQHKITEATFNDCLTNFWGSLASVLEPTTKSWTEMDTTTAGHDCSQMRWKLEMDENDMNNNHISLSLVPIPDHETTVNYSIALFKGVHEAYGAETFHFYKARQEGGDHDIIFKAVNAGGATVYFGDLNSLYP